MSAPYSITRAEPSYDDQLRSRRKRYMIMMGLRVPFLVAAAALYQTPWLALLMIAVSIPLPWIAVLIANDRPARKRQPGGSHGEPRARTSARPARDRRQRARRHRTWLVRHGSGARLTRPHQAVRARARPGDRSGLARDPFRATSRDVPARDPVAYRGDVPAGLISPVLHVRRPDGAIPVRPTGAPSRWPDPAGLPLATRRRCRPRHRRRGRPAARRRAPTRPAARR